jgi:hypothetical protein
VSSSQPPRHPTTATWVLPPDDRPPAPAGVERVNLRELVGRADRFEHHLIVVATIGGVQLEVATASEPLYFAHVNISDEYAMALPTGDPMLDAFPMRTFLADATTGADVGRYNHKVGDLVLHPLGHAHWPGRLRAPYTPFDFAPGMRRCGLSLVYCASVPTPATHVEVAPPEGREGDAKAYVTPPPRMTLASRTQTPGLLARVGDTTLELVERVGVLPNGGWVVVLAAAAESSHAVCDLLRVPPDGDPGRGIERALVFSSASVRPDPVPPAWTAFASPAFPPFEEAGPPEELPFTHGALHVEASAADPTRVRATIDGVTAEVPRYWLARMLFRVGLHGVRIGYVETYEGFFVDDHADPESAEIELGLRTPVSRAAITVPRIEAAAVLERLYRAVAPAGYRERVE